MVDRDVMMVMILKMIDISMLLVILIMMMIDIDDCWL